MRIEPTAIQGSALIKLEPARDERGYFARLTDTDALERAGLPFAAVQTSLSSNDRLGTLRGMHYQAAPREESKLVTCIRGAIYDVIVDLRPGSATYRTWLGVRLDARSFDTLLVPQGCAHGFLTLEDDSVVLYQISERYHAESARGIRYDDPRIGIAWPGPARVISERDRSYALLED